MRVYKYEVTREYVGDGSELYQVSMPQVVANFLESRMLHKMPEEHFYVILLDTRNNVVGYHEVSKGLVDRSHVHPREVFRVAILENASKIIIAHNHPSGFMNPSTQDISMTKTLVEAGELLGIKIMDHIIVAEILGDFEFISMREKGYVS